MTDSSVAVVILNWNGIKLLQQFLPGVVEHSKPYRVVLADNASTDDSVAWAKEHFPEVQIVVNASNGGYAKGYNDALKSVQAEYFVLLNSDVEVTAGWLEPMVEQMKNPQISGCQPKILSQQRKDEFEYAGASGGFIDKYHFPFCRGRIFDQIEKDQQQYDYSVPVFWASGACLFIRAEVFNLLEGFDERFFAHFEEIDLCWRAQRLGGHFVVEPKSVVYHVGGSTLSYNNPRKTFLNFRNSLLMIHKNQPTMLWWVLFRRMSIDGLAGVNFLIRGQFKHLWAIFKAHFGFYGMLGSSRKERKKWKHLKQRATVGTYKGSLLWAKYAQRVSKFSDLNQRKFQR